MRWRNLFHTEAGRWTVVVRLIVGFAVFFPEGLQRLIYPYILGAGGFAGIGIPIPYFLSPFVGIVETICGSLIIVGLFIRLAAIPRIIVMLVAIISTKVPILLGRVFWIFHAQKLSRYGFSSVAHEARADFAMLLGAIFLLIEAAGTRSVDRMLSRRSVAPPPRTQSYELIL